MVLVDLEDHLLQVRVQLPMVVEPGGTGRPDTMPYYIGTSGLTGTGGGEVVPLVVQEQQVCLTLQDGVVETVVLVSSL